MKLITLLLGVFCIILAYTLVFGHNGIKQYQAVEVALEQEQNRALLLQKRNEDVSEQINDLMQGSIAVEELARSELGLVKPNERFYRVLAPVETGIDTHSFHIN